MLINLSALRYLLIIGLILTASGFSSDILAEYLGPIEYKGYLVFDYPEGENPINNIVFNVDSTLADSLIIVSVPSIWSYSYGGGTLTLSGGSVSPGGSVKVTVSLNKYFEDGEYPVNSVGTTTAGDVSQASGPLLVGELYLLNFLEMASAYRFPLAAIVVCLGFLELFLSRRKHVDLDNLPSVKTTVDTLARDEGRTTSDTVYGSSSNVIRGAEDELGETTFRNDAFGRVIVTDDSDSQPKPTMEDTEKTREWLTENIVSDSDLPKWRITGNEKASTDISEGYFGDDRGGIEARTDVDSDTDEKSTDSSDSVESVVPELAPYYPNEPPKTQDEAAKEKIPIRDFLSGSTNVKWDLSPPPQDPEEIADKLGDILLDGTKKSSEVDGGKPDKTGTDTPSTDSSEYDDSDLPGLDDLKETDTMSAQPNNISPETRVHGELEGRTGSIYFPFIKGRSQDLGLSESDLKTMGEFKIDFDSTPTETVLNDIRITPLLSGEGTLELGDPINFKSTLNFNARKNEIRIPLPFEHEPIKPSLGQIIENEVSLDGKVNSYYRVYYDPIPQFNGGITLVDTQGNLIFPSEDGGMKIEFDPTLGVPTESKLPIIIDTRISQLFKVQGTPKPPETIILLDVKISTSDD